MSAQTLKTFLTTTVDKQVKELVKGINSLERLHTQSHSNENLSTAFETDRLCLMLESQMRDLNILICSFMKNYRGIIGYENYLE